MATQILTDGTTKEVTPANGSVFSLEEMQELVGGYIAPIHLNDNLVMMVDEDGYLKELAVNKVATLRVISSLPTRTTIVGSVLIATRKEAGYDAEEEE